MVDFQLEQLALLWLNFFLTCVIYLKKEFKGKKFSSNKVKLKKLSKLN